MHMLESEWPMIASEMLFQLYQRNLNQPVTTEKFRQTRRVLPRNRPDPKLENFLSNG